MLANSRLLCPPGESSVLLPLPSYFNHAMSLSLQQVEPAYIPCSPKDGFTPSLPAARAILETARDSGSKVKPRAIVLVTPNNPTGAIYSPSLLEEWYALAREFDVPLVLDETYRDFAGAQPHTLFERPEWRETLITLGSFSSESLLFPWPRLSDYDVGVDRERSAVVFTAP